MTLKYPKLGSEVTVTGSTSSGGFPNEKYTLWEASSNLPNSRYIEAGANITLVNDGVKITIVGGSSGSGAPISASYLTVNTEASLTGSRRIAAGTGIDLVDNTSTMDVSVSNTVLGAKFITFGPEAVLTNERTLGVAGGLTIQDTGTAITVSASDLQPLDSTLTSFSTFNTNGLITQTAPDTFTGRTITGTTNRISITNGNGVSGNPTIDIGTDVALSSENYITIGNTSGLSNERRIEVAGGLTIQDNGPGNSVVISASGVTGGAGGGFTYSAITTQTTGQWNYAYGADISGGGFTFTLPTAVGNAGKEIIVKVTNNASPNPNTFTIGFTGGQNADGQTAITTVYKYDCYRFMSDGAQILLVT